MKFAVKILPRPEVLDPQGRAVEITLRRHGHELQSCQVGRYIVLDIPGSNLAAGQKQAQAMAENGLYNPLIEVYELEAL